MSRDEFIIQVFCVVDRFMQKITENKPLRSRGPAPQLSDVEAITLELVGEFLGLDSDKAIWEYFKANWSHFFSKTRRQNDVRQTSGESLVLGSTAPTGLCC